MHLRDIAAGRPNADTRNALQKLKAKIVRLHSTRLQQLLADNNAAERIDGEQPTTYNVLQMRTRRNERTITALRNLEGIIQKSPGGIARTLATYLRVKYERIEVNTESTQRLLPEIGMNLADQDKDALMAPLTPGEIEQAIRAGG